MEIDDATLQRLRQLLAPDFNRSPRPRVISGGSALPKSQGDGTRIVYWARAATTGATADERYELVFDLASGYWYVAGAAAMYAYVAGSFASSATATWQDTLTPKITVPLAGDYEVEVSAIANQATSVVWPVRMAPIQNGSTGPTIYAETKVDIGTTESMILFEPAVNVIAGTVFSISTYTNDGTPAHTTWTQRALRVRPVRVTG